MSQGIAVGSIAGDGTLIWDCHEFIFSRVGIFMFGSFGGGTITFRAGKTGATQVLKSVNPTTGSHTNVIVTTSGNYILDVMADEISFAMVGSTTPAVTVRAYPENIR